MVGQDFANNITDGFVCISTELKISLWQDQFRCFSPSRQLQVGDLPKLGTLLLLPVDPVHQVLYVPRPGWLPCRHFGLSRTKAPLVLVRRRGEAGGAETGSGEKRLGRRVWKPTGPEIVVTQLHYNVFL